MSVLIIAAGVAGTISTYLSVCWLTRDKPNPADRAEPDPLLELAEAHRLELEVWDEQFRQVTGKLVDPPRVIQGSYSELLAPGLTPKHVFDQQHQQNMQRMLAMAQTRDNQYYQNMQNQAVLAQQQSQSGLASSLGANLANIFGGIH